MESLIRFSCDRVLMRTVSDRSPRAAALLNLVYTSMATWPMEMACSWMFCGRPWRPESIAKQVVCSCCVRPRAMVKVRDSICWRTEVTEV